MDEGTRSVDTKDKSQIKESDDKSEEINERTREDGFVGMEDLEEERRDVTK